jgi:hypothetical protein
MTRSPRQTGFVCLSLLALALGGFLPARAAAGSLGFQNDTNLVVMVQGSSTDAQGRVHFGQPHKLNPKDTAWEKVGPGVKNIIIYDPKNPKTIFYQGPINVGVKDELFSVSQDAAKNVKIAPLPAPGAAMMPKK